VEADVSVDSEMLLLTDFINLKIKPTQTFRCDHRAKMCVYLFVEMSVYMCIQVFMFVVYF
jgi:hypothetical protein